MTWKCSSCTFINHNGNDMTKCKMCNTPKTTTDNQTDNEKPICTTSTNPSIIIIDELLTIFDGDTGTIKSDREETLEPTLQS